MPYLFVSKMSAVVETVPLVFKGEFLPFHTKTSATVEELKMEKWNALKVKQKGGVK